MRVIAIISAALFLLGGCSFAPTKQTREPLAVVQTLSGAGNVRFGEVFGVALDKNGAIFLSDGAKGKIWRVEQNGTTRIVTDKLNTPSGLAVDKDGSLIVADSGSHTIKRINPEIGSVSIIAGVENSSGFADGASTTALFHSPVGAAVAANGRIYVADTYNDKIRIIENGQVRTLAGNERGFADGIQAKFDTPCGIVIDKDENVLVADTGNRRIRKIDAGGMVTTLAGTGEFGKENGWSYEATFAEPTGISLDQFGAIYVADAGTNAIRVFGRHLAPFWETLSQNGRGVIDGNLLQAKFNRPTNVAIEMTGKIFVADSANKLVRVIEPENSKIGSQIEPEMAKKLFLSSEQMRGGGEPRWPYNPPAQPRDIAGTFGEVRGEIKQPGDPGRFHNGLDIAGSLGETARFIRSEKVLRPVAADNFGGLRELLRLPTIGYIHIRLGRDGNGNLFDDPRFLFNRDASGKLNGLRVPRGAKFEAGDAVGTLNPMNHVHLIAGETGAETNAFAALELPGVKDSVAPKIEKVLLYDENWREFKPGESFHGKIRIVVRAFDQMDGNNARRRLGVYRLGYQILSNDNSPIAGFTEPQTTISFERLPDNESGANFVYAFGSQSGYTPDTVFNYIVTNIVRDGGAREEFFDTTQLPNGDYKIGVFAADFFGNQTTQKIPVKIVN
ncbi:MAG: hypothetical protein ABI954_00090 [Pyrinomonadaceae bacterium]